MGKPPLGKTTDGKAVNARAEAWLAENKKALDAGNDYVREHGLPLERFRQF